MKDAPASRGAAPTFLPAAARRARPRLARAPRTGSVRTAGSGPGGDLGPGRRRRRTRQPTPSPVTAARPAPFLTTFRLPLCSVRGLRRPWRARGPARFTRGKATVRMTSLDQQRSTRQTPRTIARQATRTTRTADAPAAPSPAVAPGQRRNVPAGGDRGL
jgi:hypothetical protein